MIVTETNPDMVHLDVSWVQANQCYLLAALNMVKYTLECHLARLQGTDVIAESREELLQQALAEAEASMPAPAHVSKLCEVFDLSPFERDVLLVCAGIELDSDFSALCTAIQTHRMHPSTETASDDQHGGSEVAAPTFSLMREIFPHAYWDAFMPVAPLRYWHLLELSSENVLMRRSLRIDEYILHYLTGASYLDERLMYLFEACAHGTTEDVVPSQRALVENLTTLWSPYTRDLGRGVTLRAPVDMTDAAPYGANGRTQGDAPTQGRIPKDIPPAYPLVQLCGEDTMSIYNIVTAACEALGLQLRSLSSASIVSLPTYDLARIMHLWERMAALHGIVLLLDCSQSEDAERSASLSWLVQHLNSPLIVMSRERLGFAGISRLSVTYEVARPGTAEARAIWQRSLREFGQNYGEYIDRIVSQFRLSSSTIRTAVAEVLAVPQPTLAEDELSARLWDACRVHTRPGLSALAQRVDVHVGWQDLVLPEAQLQLLRGIVAQVRNRAIVYDTWGFGPAGSTRGLGISVMFAGMSGTGKTLAAEVLACELRLDLYRIDLSSVVSKYIGETEKNLQRVFDAAEEGGVVLLFDEADALFGKRSDVRDSHDRYANIEVSYLLQRMETYRGLAILTTNLKSSVDVAFLRRLRFVIQFPFPDATQRAEIWRRTFPPSLPVSNLDVNKLARLSVAGGNIRNIALNAAFFAAEEQQDMQMKHVLNAARMEYAKLEKSLTDSEIEGWV